MPAWFKGVRVCYFLTMLVHHSAAATDHHFGTVVLLVAVVFAFVS